MSVFRIMRGMVPEPRMVYSLSTSGFDEALGVVALGGFLLLMGIKYLPLHLTEKAA